MPRKNRIKYLRPIIVNNKLYKWLIDRDINKESNILRIWNEEKKLIFWGYMDGRVVTPFAVREKILDPYPKFYVAESAIDIIIVKILSKNYYKIILDGDKVNQEKYPQRTVNTKNCQEVLIRAKYKWVIHLDEYFQYFLYDSVEF